MTDLLQRGATFLEDQRHKHMTRPVVYLRGSDSVEVQATIGRTVFDQQDQFGVLHRTESRDFLIRAADLVLAGAMTPPNAGETTLPKAGDRVREPAGTAALLYEVMAPEGEPPFRYSDPERITLRIHTKFIGLEVSP